MSYFQRLIGFFKGNDVFISYARADASNYALGLANELTKRELSCFIDQWGTLPGEELPMPLLKALRHSSMMVLLGTEKAGASDAIKREVEEFIKTERMVHPISFGKTVENASWFPLLKGLPIADEALDCLVHGRPSEHVISRIINAKGFTRRNKRLRRVFWMTAATSLLVIMVSAGSSSYFKGLAEEQQTVTQLENQSRMIMRQFHEGSNQIKALLAAAKNGEALQKLVPRAQLFDTYPTMTPLTVLQTVLENIEHKMTLSTHRSNVGVADDWEIIALTETIDVEQTGPYNNYRGVVRLVTRAGQDLGHWVVNEPGKVVFDRNGQSFMLLTQDMLSFDVMGHFEERHIAHTRGIQDIREWTVNEDRDRFAGLMIDGNAVILDNTGEIVNFLQVESRQIRTIIFPSHSRTIVGLTSQGDITIWDSEGHQLNSFHCGEGAAHHAVVTPNGKSIVVAAKTLAICDDAGTLLHQWSDLRTHKLAVHPSEPIIATGGRGWIRIWNFSGQLLTEIPLNHNSPELLQFDPEGRWVLAAVKPPRFDLLNQRQRIKIWSLTGQLLFDLPHPAVKALYVKPDGRTLISAGDDVRLWDLSHRYRELIPQKGLLDLSVMSSEHVLTFDTDGNVDLWDSHGVSKNHSHLGDGRSIITGQFSADARRLAVTYNSGSGGLFELTAEDANIVKDVSVYPPSVQLELQSDVHIPEVKKALESRGLQNLDIYGFGKDGKVFHLLIRSRTDTRLASNVEERILAMFRDAFPDNTVVVKRGPTMVKDIHVKGVREAYSSILVPFFDIIFSPDFSRFVAASPKRFELRDTQGGMTIPLGEIGEPVINYRSPSFSLDGNFIATIRRATVDIWDSTGEKVGKIDSNQGVIFDVAFSKDGEILATAGEDGTIKLWNKARQLISEWTAHSDRIQKLCYSPDSQLLSSYGEDGSLRIWDRKGRQIAEFSVLPAGEATASEFTLKYIRFSQDGRYIAIYGEEERNKKPVVRIWEVEGLDQLINKARTWLQEDSFQTSSSVSQ